ncbi:hypothetical protein ACS0TY_005951 [Phlomoides rotata]
MFVSLHFILKPLLLLVLVSRLLFLEIIVSLKSEIREKERRKTIPDQVLKDFSFRRGEWNIGVAFNLNHISDAQKWRRGGHSESA